MTKVVSPSFLLKISATKELPVPDQEAMFNPQVSEFMMSILYLALRQGYSAAVSEACILFRKKQSFEDSLKRHYEQPNRQDYYPRISIYQGDLDVNVPKSHATFISHDLLAGTPNLVEHPDLGHLSLVLTEASAYSRFAVSSESK